MKWLAAGAAAAFVAAAVVAAWVAFSPSVPGPLGGPWREVSRSMAIGGGVGAIDFEPGVVIEDGRGRSARYRVSADGKSVVVESGSTREEFTIDAGRSTARSADRFLLRVK